MTVVLLGAIFAVSAIGAFLFAGVDTATLAVSRATLDQKLRAAGEEAEDIFRLVSDAQRALAVAVVGVNVCALAGAFALFGLMQRLLSGRLNALAVPGVALVLTVIVATPVYLLATETLPRPLARRRAAQFIMAMRGALRASAALSLPLLRGCEAAASWALRPFGIKKAALKRPMTTAQILAMIGQSQAAGAMDVSEREMIEGAIDLESISVREIMRPLMDVVAVKLPEATVETVLETARATGYSRFPAFRQRIIEMAEYVDARQILREGAETGRLDPYIKPALIAPETMRIASLLREFMDRHEHGAIVIDEYGGVAGWVTREDILKEIVGDIADKATDEEPRWTRDERGVFHVEARMDLDDLNAETGAHLAKGDDYDTLGGWIYARVGRVPKAGERVEADGAAVTVEAMERHRIVRAAVKLGEEAKTM